MPEYLTPGVYVEEISIGDKPIEGVSTSNLGVLGLTQRGPTSVKLVTSFGEYMTCYGGYLKDSYTTYAVEGFFKNGGKRCFVGRVVKEGASSATLSADPIDVDAIGEGAWGRRVAMRVENAGLHDDDNDLFKLTIGYWDDEAEITTDNETTLDKAVSLEVYDNLSIDTSSRDHFVTKVNKLTSLVEFGGALSGGRPANTADFTVLKLTGGDDGTDLTPVSFRGDPTADEGEKAGLEAFKEVDEINIVYLADLHNATDTDAVSKDVEAHCKNLGDRFCILEAPRDSKKVTDIKKPVISSYAGFYYPWIKVYDPLTQSRKLVPAGGYVAGIYARSDIERGVHKAPANEIVKGALELEFELSKEKQGLLNPKGINVIRKFPGRGMRVWGARTTDSDPEWKYINVRRLFLFLEESIDQGTQWVVFEPNNEQLWARVKQSITNFLTTVWRTGALMGTTPEEAFFVEIGRSTMTQADIDNGKLICLIGVAPTKPAEFVIFCIAQWTATSA